MNELIKSKERVQIFGEVFTPIFIVKKMLLEVEDEIKKLETKFLEPSAGEGAFLCELLRQRLNFFRNGDERILLTALANIYGVELLQENISVAREEMKKIFREFCRDEEILQTADLIIEKNIVCADALELENILFGDWQFFPTVRTIFKFKKSIQLNLFEEENFMAEKKSSLVILGNPPYQKDFEEGTTSKFAPPIYHKFLEQAWELGDKVIMIHPARCLFNAGATPKDFNEKLLQNEHIKVVDYEPDSSKVFRNTNITGGVAVTYFDKEKNFGAIDTFTPFPELNSILHKVVVNNKNFSPITEIVFSQKLFKLNSKFYEDFPEINPSEGRSLKTNLFGLLPNLFFKEQPEDGKNYVQIIGREGSGRAKKFFRADYVEDVENLYKYKIYLSKANGAAGRLTEGESHFIIGVPQIAFPNTATTETFITIGAFETLAEARALEKYIKTKFCRAMVGILKITQDITPEKWAKVPLQDFSAGSDIDWSKNISEIDAQLYEKYSLSAEEIKFIESKVKEMI